MSVDPYEAVIKLAQADYNLADVTGNQIAQRHRYGQDSSEWDLDSAALVFRPVGGPPDLHLGQQRVQIEAHCYADTPIECGEIVRALIEWTRQPRRVVEVTEGDALVYYVLPRANARLLMDDEIRPQGMPDYMVLLESAVAEQTV